MTEDQYLCLKHITNSLIQVDKTLGKEIKFENITSYIDKALSMISIPCDQQTKDKLFVDIEYQFKITHAKGHVIFDDYNTQRDWYKNDVEDPYFWRRYKSYLLSNTSISSKSITLLDEDTLPCIMNCLGNPKEVLDGPRMRRGLIIGDVQSGKTATYIGLICKAADAGYRVVILLAGVTESLRQQTQERVDEGIVGITKKRRGRQIVTEKVGVGNDNRELRATSFTSCTNDFVGNCDKIAMSLNSHNSLVLFVVKKNVSVLAKLHKWLKDQNLDVLKGYIDQPMLLIDDEADNASVNTKKDETDPTKTNKLIRDICGLFKNSTYVGFTATPFANVFIDPDSVDSMRHADLFPEHFIYALEAPSNYVGAQKIFYEDSPFYSNLRFITDIEEPDYTSEEYHDALENDIESLNSGPFYYRHKKEWDGVLPNSLRDSILCFFLANAVRDLRGQQLAPRSMLINMSRFIKVQRVITAYVNDIREKVFDDLRYNFSEDDSENTDLPLYKELYSLWSRHFTNISDISFNRVIKKQTIMSAIEKVKVLTVNGSKQSGSLDYRTNKSLRVIAVGGLALSRGLTLEGLMVSYFYRNTSTFDVLMQMGRWFGYRAGYEDLFQIWTSKTSAEWYAEIARSSNELRSDIKDMFEQRLTPKDFGIKVRDNSSELQITAPNKMRSACSIDMRYSFYGNIYDTPYVSFNIAHNKKNLFVVSNLVKLLRENSYKFRYADVIRKSSDDVNNPSDGSSRFFSDVPKKIILDLVKELKCSMANPNFNTANIISFLENPENIGLEKWNVVFVGGESNDKYNIEGLEYISCMKRSIFQSSKNVVQLSSRRRVLSGSTEGFYTLTQQEKEQAETTCRNIWKENNESVTGRQIPLKAYFEYLPERKPVFVIMLIQPTPESDDPNKADSDRIKKFRKELGSDKIVAFAIGLPGVKESAQSVKYKINKVFQKLNIEDLEEEEVDDEE